MSARLEMRGRLQDWASLLHFTTTKDLLFLALAIFVALCSGLIEPITSIYFARFFDAFSQFGSQQIDDSQFMYRTRMVVIILAGISATIFLLRSAYLCLWLLFGEMQAMAARKTLVRTFLDTNADLTNFTKDGPGSQSTQLQSCVRDFQLGVSQPLGFVISNASQCLAALGIALYYEWRLALLILSTLILAILCLSFIIRKLPLEIKTQQSSMVAASKTIFHVINNIATVKCCNAEKQERLSYCKSVGLASIFYMRQAKLTSARIGLTGFAMTSILVLALFCATELIQRGRTTPEAAMTTFFSCLMAAQGFQNMLPYFTILEKGMVGARSLCSALSDVQQSTLCRSNHRRLTPSSLDGEIVFNDVSFAYATRPDHVVLRKVNIVLPAGRLAFLVGESGSGKSTIAGLLQAKHRPVDGFISIDGFDIQNLDRDWLRNNITVVPQSASLFNETISQNIAFGAFDATLNQNEAINEALGFAEILTEVLQLPESLQTVLDVGGFSLSGGQRQRLVLARTYLRNTPILILDEPTAALDPYLRIAIMTKLRSWRKGKTTILITHDRGLIDVGDAVFEVAKGKVVGDHQYSPCAGSQSYTDSCEPEQSLSTHSRQDPHSDRIASPQKDFNRPNSLTLWDSLHERYEWQTHLSKPILHRRSVISWYRSSLLDNHFYSHDIAARNIDHVATFGERYSTFERNDEVVTLNEYGKKNLSIDEDNKDMTSFQAIGRLRAIIKSFWTQINIQCRAESVGGLCFAAIYAACPAIFSYIIVRTFENWFRQDNWQSRARVLVAAGIGLAIIDGLSSFFMHYIFEDVANTWVEILRVQAVARILDQPKSWFDTEDASAPYISTTLSHSAEVLRNIVGRYCALALVAFIMIVIALLWSFKICWKVTVVIVAFMPVLYGITKLFQMSSQHWEGRSNSASEHVNRVFAEILSELDTIRGLTLESHFHRKYLFAATKTFRVGIKRAAVIGFCFGLSESAIYFVTTAIFAYGAVLVKAEEFGVGAVLQSFALILFSTSNANSIIAYIPQVSSSIDAGLKVLRLTSLPTGSSHGEIQLDTRTGNHEFIVFRNLKFQYPSRPELTILHKLNLQIKPHQWTAIVGASGSGKSTIASILLKLYATSVSNGRVNAQARVPALSICGCDIESLNTQSLRTAVAIVPQHPVIIPGTVRENILYGTVSEGLACGTNLYAAARVAGIHDFIMTLPQQYETVLEEDNLSLSGGQAQRIAVARAVVRQPSILVLDEATSALDQKTTKEIGDSLVWWSQHDNSPGDNKKRCHAGRTAIICITHDVEMMKLADEIVLIENGSVSEQGTFQDLLRRKDQFSRFLHTISSQ